MVGIIAIHLRENKWSVFVLLYYKCQSTLVLLPRKSQGQRSLVGYSSWGCKRVRQKLSDYKIKTLLLLNYCLKYFKTMLSLYICSLSQYCVNYYFITDYIMLYKDIFLLILLFYDIEVCNLAFF